MAFTHCDAETAFKDGSYKTRSEEELEEMRHACVNVTGSNQVNVGRVRSIGEALGAELAERRKRRQDHEQSGMLSAGAKDSLTFVSKPGRIDSQVPWDEAGLQTLIRDGIEESIDLEYKAAGALDKKEQFKLEISKDVSSFANAGGGTIIYGIAEFQEKEKRHLPERIDPVIRTFYSKEWLEHIIGQIRPRISDIKITPVILKSGLDHVAYVVEIPQGTTAHQATDRRYYRRYNFEAAPMLDHEIRDVMNRKSHPRILVQARFVEYPRPNQDRDNGALIINITNDSDTLARYIAIAVYAPLQFNNRLIGYHDAILHTISEGSIYRLSFSNHNGAPLFPRATCTVLFRFHYARLNPEPQPKAAGFRYTVYADSMPKQEGRFDYADVLCQPDAINTP